MARKKVEPITSLGNEDKLTVQKSLPLFSLWRSELTLSEFKIMDTYLARIDSHKPDKRTVTFEKGELEKLLGVKRIRTEELDERLKHLGTPIKLNDPSSKNKRFTRISLFEKSVAEQDENGLWQVELTASQSAMKYFFNVENLGYLRYKLRCITSLTSRYTYIMFIWLEANRFRMSWEVDLEELKVILHCDTEEYAKEFKYFNRDVLKKVQKELHEKTECRYSYEPIKKGRRVIAIRFTLEPINPEIDLPLPGQISFADHPANQGTDLIELLRSATTPPGSDEPEFSRAEMEHLFTTLATVSVDKLPQIDDNNIDLRRYHYLAEKYAAMNRQAEKKQIKHRFAYLLKLIV